MSNVAIQPGGSPTPALATVVADQQTIFGAGTPTDPLTTNGGSSGGPIFEATIVSVGSNHVGQPVALSATPPTVGIVSVGKASGVSTQAVAQCCGLVISLGGIGVPAVIQYGGIVELTTAEWDAVAGTSGGLVVSEPYYLGASGQINDVAPSATGNWSSQVGVALSSTQLILSTPSVPIGPHA